MPAPAYIEMLTRDGTLAVCLVSVETGEILVFEDGYTAGELPWFGKEFSGWQNISSAYENKGES